MNINKLDGYEFNEQDKFNGFSVNSSNGSSDNSEIQEIKAKNQSQDEEIKKVSDSNKLQDEEIKKLTVDIAEDNNVFTISQGGKELAKIHQLEGKSASIVSGSLENGNLVLTKDNAQTVNVDMGQLALKASVPTKVSQLENDSEFVTGENLLTNLEAKANIEHTHKLQDITDYTAPVIPTKVSQLENDSEFVTGENLLTNLEAKANIEHTHKLQDITDYTAPVIPTKVSQLENDSNFLTEHQSLDGYIHGEEAVKEIIKNYNTDKGILDLTTAESHFLQKSDIDSAISEDSEKPVQNKAINSYLNSTFLKKSEATDFLNSTVTSTTYSTKSELNTLETKLENMINSNNGELHFTGTTLNGITSLAAAIQALADKLDNGDHL